MSEGRQLELLELEYRGFDLEKADLVRELHEASRDATSLDDVGVAVALGRAIRAGLKFGTLDRGSYVCHCFVEADNILAPPHSWLMAPSDASLALASQP
jgi:hypothetical protein